MSLQAQSSEDDDGLELPPYRSRIQSFKSTEHLDEHCDTEEGEVHQVILTRDRQGSFGLSIAGGLISRFGRIPIVVTNLVPGGPADASGMIKLGDEISAVEGESTDEMTHEEVVQLLRHRESSVTLDMVSAEEFILEAIEKNIRKKLVTAQPPARDHKAPHTSLVHEVVLERGPLGLGFSIVGGSESPYGDLPIFVKSVFEPSVGAGMDGLYRGDQILAVNDVNLVGATHTEAVEVLKKVKNVVHLKVIS